MQRSNASGVDPPGPRVIRAQRPLGQEVMKVQESLRADSEPTTNMSPRDFQGADEDSLNIADLVGVGRKRDTS